MNENINKIICGDSLEVIKKFPNDCIDLMLCSPPYDKIRKYNGYSFDFENIVKELFRIIKIGGVVVWVVNDEVINGSESGTSFKQALYFKEIGFNLHDTMIFKKKNPTPCNHNRYEQDFEFMFVFSKGKPKTFNPIKIKCKYANYLKHMDVRKLSNFNEDTKVNHRRTDYNIKEEKIKGNTWEYGIGWSASTTDKNAFQHPAIFPDKLAEDHIISWTNEGDLVLDIFCGSGTTCKMAKLNRRKFIGIDISEDYCKIARERVNSVNELKIFKKDFDNNF